MIETVYSAKRKTHSILKGKQSTRCHCITWTSHRFLQNLHSFVSTEYKHNRTKLNLKKTFVLFARMGCLFLDFFAFQIVNWRLTDWLTVSASVWLHPGQGGNLFFIQTAQIRALMPLNAAGQVSPFVSHINTPNRLQCWLSDWTPQARFVRLTSSLCGCVGGFYTLKRNWWWYYKLLQLIKKKKCITHS